MGGNRSLCKAKTRAGGTCPHYALPMADFCKTHAGPAPGGMRQCRANDCDKRIQWNQSGMCVSHQILALAPYLRDAEELRQVIAELGAVEVLTPESRTAQRRDTWLRMVAQSAKDRNRYADLAREAGANEAEIVASFAIGNAAGQTQ